MIHADDIKQPFESDYSEYSDCFYILDGTNDAMTSLKRVWKIRLDDQIPTVFVSFSEGYSTLAASSDGGLFVASSNQNCDETRIVVYDFNAKPKNIGTIGGYSDMPYFLKTQFLKFASNEKLYICEHPDAQFIHGLNVGNDYVPFIFLDWRVFDLPNEGKDEVHPLWTRSPHRLNISETRNGNHSSIEADEKSLVRLLYAHWKFSGVTCALTTLSSRSGFCRDIPRILNDLEDDLREFHLCSGTSKRCREVVEMLREDRTLSSCIVSAAMQSGQTGLVALPKSKSGHCSVEIYNVPYKYSTIT